MTMAKATPSSCYTASLPIDEATEMAWLRGEINAFLQTETTG